MAAHFWTITLRRFSRAGRVSVNALLGVFVASLLIAVPAHAAAPAVSVVLADSIRDEGANDLTRVEVTWAQSTLLIGVTYSVPPQTSALKLVVSEAALDEHDPDVEECDPGADGVLDFRASNGVGTIDVSDGSRLSVVGQWDPTRTSVRYAFSSPELSTALAPGKLDPFTCVSGDAGGDDFYGGFPGKILKLSPAVAVEALRADLSRRYGAQFEATPKRWLACPKEEILPAVEADETFDGGPALVLCEFEFRESGKTFRGGSGTAVLQSGVPVLTNFSSRAYTKRLRSCRIAPTKGGCVNGVRLTGRKLRAAESLGSPCRWLVGGASMAQDLESEVARRYPRPMPSRYTVGLHGTNRAGFDDSVRFPCRVTRRGARYTFRCRNRLGDVFVHAFTVSHKTPRAKAPKKPSGGGPGRSCDPNYEGACLDPNASDYDCSGGSGDGPRYTGRVRVVGTDHYDLDRDGNGIACES